MKKIISWILVFIVAYTFYTTIVLLLFRWIDPPITAFIQQTNPDKLEAVLTLSKVSQTWMPLENISDEIKIAILTSEDQRFLEHWGFDTKQIEKVLDNFEKGKKMRGASTITQQVAKNLFLSSDKSLIRKILESYDTVLIELLWSKKRILEVYLNIAQFGDRIYGVEAASSFYFKRSASYLNSREGAMLASILPNPIRYKLKQPSQYLQNRIERILQASKYVDRKEIIKELN